jgi:hypothetical protein
MNPNFLTKPEYLFTSVKPDSQNQFTIMQVFGQPFVLLATTCYLYQQVFWYCALLVMHRVTLHGASTIVLILI